jgi:hypothetical protein
MDRHVIEYHIASVGPGWGIFRDGAQFASRTDASDAVAIASFFAEREASMGTRGVRVLAEQEMHHVLARVNLIRGRM